MLELIKLIPTRDEFSAMTEDEKSLLMCALSTVQQRHDLPKVDVEYHPAERVAILAAYNSYILDFIQEFDLGIDYDEAVSL
jgi:hypothetical protein